MRIHHSLPETEADAHDYQEPCPRSPQLTVVARPGRQPVVTTTHHPFKVRSTR